MKKEENNVIINVALTSQNQYCFFDVNVTEMAVTTLVNSKLSVTLKNKEGEEN